MSFLEFMPEELPCFREIKLIGRQPANFKTFGFTLQPDLAVKNPACVPLRTQIFPAQSPQVIQQFHIQQFARLIMPRQAMSSGLGDGSPLGWLCITRNGSCAMTNSSFEEFPYPHLRRIQRAAVNSNNIQQRLRTSNSMTRSSSCSKALISYCTSAAASCGLCTAGRSSGDAIASRRPSSIAA